MKSTFSSDEKSVTKLDPLFGGHDSNIQLFQGSPELTITSEVNSSTESAMALIEGANDMHL